MVHRRGDADHLEDQFAAFGIAIDDCAEALEREAAEATCEYHADNELPLAAFAALQTQWRVVAGGVGVIYLGLDYSAIPTILVALEVPRKQQSDLIAALRTMERAALPLLNARDDD